MSQTVGVKVKQLGDNMPSWGTPFTLEYEDWYSSWYNVNRIIY